MLQRDRVFLQDYINFGFMNHLVAAYAFFITGGHPEEAATAVIAQASMLDKAAAAEKVQQNNEDARVQKIAIARLYGELAATLEDLGALCDAVRHGPKSDGIFHRYLRSLTPAACDAFDYARANPSANLAGILKLPELPALQASLPLELYTSFATDYKDLADHIHAAANSYRDVPSSFKPFPVPASPHSSWEQDVNIIVDLFDQNEPVGQGRGGIMAQVYNKIKHRFIVIEDLAGIVQASDTPGQILAGMLETEEQTATNLMTAIRNAVMAGTELAAILLTLDHHGISF